MPPYTAQRQGLFDNVGGPQLQRPMVDWGGAISALGQAGTSLIHQQYLREMARHTQQREDAQTQWERSKYEQDRQDRLTQQDREYQLKKQEVDATSAAKGYTPGTEGGATVKEGVPTPTIDSGATPKSAIQAQMQKGLSVATPSQGSALTKPVTPGSLGTIPTVERGEEPSTPASYDPTKALQYTTVVQRELMRDQNMTDRANIMGNWAVKRATISANAGKVNATIRGNATVDAAKARAGGGPGADGTPMSEEDLVGRMKPADRERHFKEVVAPGILRDYGGDLGAAVSDLENTPQGARLKKMGFSSVYLSAAADKRGERDQTAAVNLQRGDNALPTDSAVARVKKTRQATGGPALQGPSAIQRQMGAQGAPAGAPAKPNLATKADPQYERAASMYHAAINAGIDQRTAQKAYDDEIALIAKKAGQIK